MTKGMKFILAILLQVGIIGAIIFIKLTILTGGTEVLLRVAPVDPRSPLRGDYATFQYDISQIPSYKVVTGDVRNGDTVYVTLMKSGRYWDVEYVLLEKPYNGNKIFLKGRVVSGGSSETAFTSYTYTGDSTITVVYGIEDYFIPEGTGQNVNFFDKEAAVSVAVDENGNAVLKQVYVDNKPWP
ncbi:MAG TPA: GDYXXLXY domain-containing protein [Patescibacteria group bacterium]|nr:GDYXXLXY domain-containing protein [Patescibacteria group bacterium]